MKKWNSVLLRGMEERKRVEKEQELLRIKTGIVAEDKIIIEKDNNFKFIIRLVLTGIRLICIMQVFFLSCIGLLAMIYPKPREEIYNILHISYKILLDLLR